MHKFLSRHFEPPLLSAENLAGLILLLYPALLFLVPGGMNGSLFLIAIVSLLLLVVRRKDNRYAFDRSVLIFGVAMSSGMMVVLVSQIYHDDLSARYFDSNARFLLAAPILVVLRQMNPRSLALVQYAFSVGGIAALVMVMLSSPNLAAYALASTSFINHIHLGDMALMVGLLSLLSLNWVEKDAVPVQILKWAGLTGGLVVSVLSSARGGWVAIPVIVAVAIYARNKEKFLGRLILALLAVFLVVLAAYVFVRPIHERLWAIYSDLAQFGAGNADTSIGIRLQLWKAALHLIAEHPLLGVGADGFGSAMDGLVASGLLTPLAAAFGKAEVHNEILAQTVRFGILGLAFILAIYFVPFYMFLKALATENRQKQVAATMGMSVTLGFFVFGLTVETFDLKMTAAFYSLTVAALLAIATNKHAGVEHSNQDSRPSVP